MYGVHYTSYSVRHTLYGVYCITTCTIVPRTITVFSLSRTLYRVQLTAYNLPSTTHYVQFTAYNCTWYNSSRTIHRVQIHSEQLLSYNRSQRVIYSVHQAMLPSVIVKKSNLYLFVYSFISISIDISILILLSHTLNRSIHNWTISIYITHYTEGFEI